MLRKRRFKLRSDSNDDESINDISDISSPELPELQDEKSKSKKPKKKRNKFTDSEDKEMLKYIMTECRYTEVKGLALWKDMEILKITCHSRQSMRYRFLKTVIPNLHQYDIPKNWVEKLSWFFPDKNPHKENTKTDFTPLSMFEKWKKQSPKLRSSPRIQRNSDKNTAKKKDVGEEEGTSANEDGNSESTLPYSDSPVLKRKRKSFRQSLRFSSSSESEADEVTEGNVSGVNATSAAISPVPSPSKSAQELSKKDSSSEPSELSDYDQYLMGIAQGNKTPSKRSRSDKNSSRSDKKSSRSDKNSSRCDKNSPRSDKNSSRSDKNSYKSDKNSSKSDKNSSESGKASTSEEYVSDSEEEMDQDDAIGIQEDRRSRLRHRRHMKKVEKAFGSTTPTSSHKNLNLAKFVTNSLSEEGTKENTEVASPAKAKMKLSEFEEIISDIAQSYGLTKREVLFTIFSFNGNIENSIAYIRLGPELSQLKPWSKEEDQIISSTDEKSIKNVARIRGNKLIAVRLQFLENFPDDMIE